MEKIRIITDSTSDVPREEADRLNIGILPVHITCGGRTFREFFDITCPEYWKLLETVDEIPKTAQVAIADYKEAFEQAKQAGCTHVICVTMNGNGSGTYAAGCTARELFYAECGTDMRIELLDSQSYSFIYGRVVCECAELIMQGADFETVLSQAKSKLACIDGYLAVFDLTHLKKSGRISGGAAFVGEKLGLKPISRVRNGAVTVCDKARGEAALLPKVVKRIKNDILDPGGQTVYLLYADVDGKLLDEAERLLISEVEVKAVKRVEIGPSVTTNSGPKSVGFAFYGK